MYQVRNAPVSQKIKESKLLLDLEQKQKTHGTVAPSTLTNITDKVKDIYRRLSGKNKRSIHTSINK